VTDFKTPGLCGSNETINAALQKLEELENEIASQIDAVASDAAAAIDTKLNELTAALDSLLPELPETPPVNLQAEITNATSIDKTTPEGILKFNAAVAKIQKDFGDALDEASIVLDDLITQAEIAIGGGGDVCDLVGNFELPAANSGTGITTETIEERATGTSVSSITLKQIPKKIVSVQVKKKGTNFFGSANYKASGKTITLSDASKFTYLEVKVSYTISLIKEKPVAVKQATADPLTEEVSVVIKNVKSEEANATSKYNSLIKKFNDATTSGIPSDDIDNAFSTLTSTLQSKEFKEQMVKDFATAKAEYAKIAQDPLKYKRVVPPQKQVSATTDTKATSQKGTTKTTRTVKATTTEDRNTTKIETVKELTSSGVVTTQKPKTEKTVVTENGFLPRKIKITEYFKQYPFNFFASGNPDMERIDDDPRYKEDFGWDGGNPVVTLKKEPFTIDKIVGSYWFYDDVVAMFFYLNGDATDILPSINGKKLILEPGPRPSRDVRGNLQTYDFGHGQGAQVQGIDSINVLQVTYTVLEKIDPNFKG
jgi:hypothetical protein